jgi:hypothetical protein
LLVTIDHALLHTLRARFAAHRDRHPRVQWEDIEQRLRRHSAALAVLARMEATGGEPDVIDWNAETDVGRVTFCDCSAESPAGRRSLCFDAEALAARKANKPQGSVIETARTMGIELLTEAQYRHLQTLGEFDTRTSSWIATPPEIRARGGALFCDRRYGQVFTYHNGAESYYAARGFRGRLLV